MPDLNQLQLTDDVVDIDFDSYTAPAEFPPPIPAGIYSLAYAKPDFELKKDKDSERQYLQATLTHEVQGGEFDKRKITFDRISNKPFERQGAKASMMLDQLRALGDYSRPATNREYGEAIQSGEGKPFSAQVDWDGYCGHKDTPFEVSAEPFTVRGERNFPPAGNGSKGHLDTTQCPTCKGEVRARARITRRIPKQSAA